MTKKKMLKKVISGMLVLAFLSQPMSFQAQESLTKKATNVNILLQEPMNELFKQEAGQDAIVESLEYRYWFAENKGDALTATVDMEIDMTVIGVDYEIEADGEVSGENLSSGAILWMGPLEGEIEIDNIEYLVMVGFTKINEAVQVSVTIQSKDDSEEIEPVRFSFGDSVITEDVYQEIRDEKELISTESHADRWPTNTTYAMNSRSILDQPQLEGGSGGLGYPFIIGPSATTSFKSSAISGNGQKLYGALDKSTNRIAVSIKTYCSNVESYYRKFGTARTEIQSMTYTLKQGTKKIAYPSTFESYDFNIKKMGMETLIMPLLSDAITVLNKSLPLSTITELLSGVYGTVDEKGSGTYKTIDIKFGVFDYANFDKCGYGVPIVFVPARYSTNPVGTQDFILEGSISYRTIVSDTNVSGYIVYYDSANKAQCNMNVDFK